MLKLRHSEYNYIESTEKGTGTEIQVSKKHSIGSQ